MLSFGHNTGWQLDQCCRMDQLLSSGQAGSTQTHGSAAQLAKSFDALLATTQVIAWLLHTGQQSQNSAATEAAQ